MSGLTSAILTFHSLDDSGSVISYPPAAFVRLIEQIAARGSSFVPLAEIQRRPRSVAITFDDAFRNIYDTALPLLERRGIPATIFVVSDYCGRTNAWPGQPRRIPVLPLMSWTEIREAASRGATIGSHSVSHPYLSTIGSSSLEHELSTSRRAIEDHLGTSVTEFAYPYGAVPADRQALENAGYSCAITTRLRYVHPDDPPLLLPRLDAYYFRNPERLPNLFALPARAWLASRRFLRELRSAAR
jgi:peptidoglycan/xylan/chitin deacetylase (PgdA/CDA1 family)